MRDEKKPGEGSPTRAAASSPQEASDKLKGGLDKLPERAQEVSDKLKGILDKLPELPEGVRVSIAEAMSFVGPLPPPTMYREYEDVHAGSAERILVMAEKEQNHRTAWEREALSASGQETKRGQWLGFTITMGCIGAAMVLDVIGQEVVAGIVALGVGASGVAGLVGHFLKK